VFSFLFLHPCFHYFWVDGRPTGHSARSSPAVDTCVFAFLTSLYGMSRWVGGKVFDRSLFLFWGKSSPPAAVALLTRHTTLFPPKNILAVRDEAHHPEAFNEAGVVRSVRDRRCGNGHERVGGEPSVDPATPICPPKF